MTTWPHPLVDHHCHGVVTHDLDREEFESLLNEADRPSPLGTSLFDSMLGLAVRRWCAPVLGVDVHADPDSYLARRRDVGADEVNRRFLTAAGLSDLLVDTGFDPGRITGYEATAAYAGANGHQILRLEAVAEELLGVGVAAADFPETFRAAISGRGAVGAKSIAAYRTGLALSPTKPDDEGLVDALGRVAPGPDGAYRIAHPTIQAWLAHTAVEAGLPLQFHVGYGDADVDLAACDPLLLTGFLRATAERGVPVLLLHNYPFHRNAAYLAQVFPQVFMDLGLATHNTGALSRELIAETLELVPFGKLLYSSDAFGLAELYYLGSVLFRRGLASVLDGLVGAGEMTPADAERVTTLVSCDNARRAYGLA